MSFKALLGSCALLGKFMNLYKSVCKSFIHLKSTCLVALLSLSLRVLAQPSLFLLVLPFEFDFINLKIRYE